MRSARTWIGAVALALLLLGLGAGTIPQGVDRTEYELAARTILCDCGCHPQSVHDCSCGRAAEMREELAVLLRGGKSGQQVIDLYVERHGEQIRIAPTASGFNLVAWLGPAVAFVGAAAGLLLVLRRWRRREDLPAGSPAATPPAEAEDDPYRRRLRKDLEEYDS